MKKIFAVSAALLFSVSAVSALDFAPKFSAQEAPRKIKDAPRKVDLTPATYAIINSTPAGERVPDLTWWSDACHPAASGQGIEWVSVSGFAAQVVINGNKIYINSPLTLLSDLAQAWIEGTISDDGKTATFPTPQAYMLNNFDILFATRCNPDGTPDPNNLNLVFSIEDGNFVQTDGGVLLLTNLQGGFYGYGEKDIVMQKITDEKVSLPEGATTESYLLEFEKNDNMMRQSAMMAFDGDDVYISDPLGIENSWFTGKKSGNTITVSTPQYVGSESGFPMYVTTGKILKINKTDPFTGQPYVEIDYKVEPNADIVFTIDETTGTISSNQLLLMNSGKTERGNAYSAFNKPSYSVWTPVRVVPAPAEVTSYINLDEYAEYGLSGCMLAYTVPSYGEDETFIPQENLHYTIWFDDKPLEFYQTTVIPYYGQFSDYELNASIQLSAANYDEHSLQVAYNPKKSVAIQSYYDFNGDLVASEKKVYSIVDGQLSGVGAPVADEEAAEIIYYDITGRRITPSQGCGIVVRQTVFTNGTRKSEKVVF